MSLEPPRQTGLASWQIRAMGSLTRTSPSLWCPWMPRGSPSLLSRRWECTWGSVFWSLLHVLLTHQASDTTILTFEDVRVPVEHIIGEEGMGFTYQMLQFQVGRRNQFWKEAKNIQEERLAAAAGCLVPLSTILEETIAYTKVSEFLVLVEQFWEFQKQCLCWKLPIIQSKYVPIFGTLCYHTLTLQLLQQLHI